ncbi:hypothetical protein L211DRAFT_697444 [Terfezia boudieri ATCC MYA-4762]|uniref:HIT-type domain-containing protein n=1 Tax=Terfezia boudieri ATCC MYA-4762 TaxID=1051890 RepID=A0A3N4LTK3_9PEZI|nr:hypothetical protein L211DRAFT_697444 [Terfezia boudieri ATCC MYA-4762]
MVDTSEPLLSSLCPYCNAQPPKYCCPACSARTCSVACSKKHKVYSQCTGVRDPTAFVKRTQLANPSKLSQDYNYLMSVEKAITRGPTLSVDGPELVRESEEADSDEDGKGEGKVVLGAGQLGNAERERLARQIEETRGVVVKQAPRGMKRARENETAFVGGRKRRKTVRWTVEWLLYDQITSTNLSSTVNEPKRFLSTRVQENIPLAEAFLTKLHSKSNTRPIPISSTSTTIPSRSSNLLLQQPIASKASRRAFTSTCSFYLKAANVPANKPTLIELTPDKSLAHALKGQVVLEFPAVVVVAKGAEGILARWEVLEKPKVEVEKPEVEQRGGILGGKGDGGEMGEGGGSEKGRNEAELEMESNPPPDTTAPAPGDSKAASHSAADSPTASINASDYQTSYQPSLALLPPSVLNDPFPRAVDSKSEWLLPSPAEEV